MINLVFTSHFKKLRMKNTNPIINMNNQLIDNGNLNFTRQVTVENLNQLSIACKPKKVPFDYALDNELISFYVSNCVNNYFK